MYLKSPRVMALCAYCMLIAIPNAVAQTSANGTVRGVVRDQQGASLAGATVIATSDTVSIPIRASTDSRGIYRFPEVPPADYTISAEYPGLERAEVRATMRAGLNVDIDLSLTVEGQKESITVTREVPMVETKTATQGLNVDGDLQRGLPISVSNHWANFLAITPGMFGFQLSSGTADSYGLRGSGFDSTVIQVDGADMASAIQSITSYLSLPTELIGDVQVKTGAVDASSPIGMGAVINIATKSGSNTLHGATSVSLSRKNWSSSNIPGGTSSARDIVIPEAAAGGPIARDHAWFFGAYRYERFETGIDRTADRIATLKALDPSFTPFDNTLRGHYVFAKGTIQLSPSQRLEASSISSPQNTASATDVAVRITSIARTGGSRNMSTAVSSVWGPRIVTKAGFSYNNLGTERTPLTDEPFRSVSSDSTLSGGRRTGTDTIGVIGGQGSHTTSPYSKMTAYADLTYFQPGWGGEHEFRVGLYLQPRNHVETNVTYNSDRINSEGYVLKDARDPAKGMVLFARTVSDTDQYVGQETNARDAAFYVQDAWRVRDWLTVSAGVRLDYVKRRDELFDVVTQNSVNVGPRLSVNWSLNNDHTRVIRGSWSRIHDVLSATSGSAGSHSPGSRDFYDTDLDGTLDSVFVNPEITALAADRIIDVTRTQPFVDEATVGYRQVLPGRWSLELNFVRRAYKGRNASVEQNGIYTNGVFTGYQDEQFLQLFRVTTNTWNWPVYSGVDAQIVKDTSRLRAIGSYTRSWRNLAGTWQPNDPASFIQPDVFPNDRGFGAGLSSSNSYAGTTESSPNWQDHLVRVGLLYRAPWRMLVASNYVFQSGPYSGPIVTILPRPDPAFGPPTVTLSTGRVVSNPLATTTRFAYATRGEGQLKVPALHIVNLRVGRNFPLRGSQRVELAGELFNVANRDGDQSWFSSANVLGNVNFGKAALRQLPRTFQLTARLTF